MNNKEYDLVVLGGSIPGYYAALHGAKKGLKTAIVEENRIAGIQTLAAKMPIQTLLANDRLLRECQTATDKGLVFDGVSFDPNNFYDSIRENAEKVSGDLIEDLKKAGVDIYIGRGVVKPDHTIAVVREGANTRIFDWKNLVYAEEPITSIPLNYKENLNGYYTLENYGLLDHFPQGLIIYGSGEPACQAALIWSRLGSEVYLISPDDRLLPNFPKQVSELVYNELKELGSEVYLGYSIASIYQDSSGSFHVDIKKGKNEEVINIKGSELMYLTNPGTSLAGIEALTLDLKNGWIETDESFRTSNPNVYTWTGSAVSFDNDQSAENAAEFITATIANEKPQPFEFDDTIKSISLNPTYASIGIIDEDELEEDDILIGTYPSNSLDLKKSEEMFEIAIDPEFGEIVGAQAIGADADELIGIISMLIHLESSAEELLDLELPGTSNLVKIKNAVKDAYKNA